jgi:hypothetical protein
MRGKKFSFCLHFFWIISALLLQACGGGGGSNSQPNTASASSTVSPSSIATTSTSSSTITSSASSSSVQSTKLTIAGTVVADALANADIEFTIGTQHFSTKADALKQYSVELNVLPENIGIPFTAKATGTNNNKWVQFAALFPSITKLKTLAGSDDNLNVTEYFGVNITGLTTAEFVLANKSRRQIKTDEDRKWALLEVSTERQTEMAAVINIFLNDINTDLPKDTATTLDFLLDDNTSTAYINVLKLNNIGAINQARETLAADTNQTKTASKTIEGTYLIQSTTVNYLLDFNKDGTGRFQSGNMPSTQLNTWVATNGIKFADAPFTWVRKDKSIKISFADPILYGQISYYEDPNSSTRTYLSCDFTFNTNDPFCDLTLSSILITLTGNNEFSTDIKLSVGANIKTSNSLSPYNYADHIQYATMWDTSEFHTATKTDVVGFEWYVDNFKYIFKSDGTATQTNLLDKQEKTIDWKIENGRLVLDAGSTDFWLTYPTESGFLVTQMKRVPNDPNLSTALTRTSLVKRQSVKMASEDWVGRWSPFSVTSDSSFYDVYSNGHWRDGFDGESEGSWSALNDTRQTALSNGTWRMQRDVLAIYDGRYYTQICQGPEKDLLPLFCSVGVETKDNSFSGNTLWALWTYPLFQETANNSIWSFEYEALNLAIGANWTSKQTVRVSADKLYDYSDGKIFQLMSSTTQTVDICEYTAFSSCSQDGVLHKLIRGIEIKISKITNGGVDGGNIVYLYNQGSYWRYLDKIFMAPKNQPIDFLLAPNGGYKINSVTGCGGTLNIDRYSIPAQSEGCEISVSFVQN